METNIDINDIITEFEKTLSIEELRINKPLVSYMDDNLSIHIEDYLRNPLIERKNFERKELIKAIIRSELYLFDENNNMIKNKRIPQRRMIVFIDLPKINHNIDYIRSVFKLANYNNEIEKIELSNDIFYVFFKDEKLTKEAYKCLEEYKENNKTEFKAFIKSENLKKEYGLDEIEETVPTISNIILNSDNHIPRKISLEENTFSSQKYKNYDYNKDDYSKKRQSQNWNKYDIVEYENYNNHNKRKKANSINYKFTPQNKLPLNKNYDLFNQEIKFSYNLKDITRICVNLSLLKKFELPEEFQKLFINEIMTKNSKSNLDHFKYKLTRERSATTYKPYYKNNQKRTNSTADEYFNLRRDRYNSKV